MVRVEFESVSLAHCLLKRKRRHTMPTATWQGTTIAEAPSADIVTVDGNLYFPLIAVGAAHLKPSSHTTVCSWKGTAHYYDVVVGGNVNQNAAWYYPEPKDAAKEIKGYVAFWKGVEVRS
jgi:uncharacterized protein (DUF427 family)